VESLRDWATGSVLRAGILAGTLFGGFVVVQSIVRGDGAVGVAAGVLAGVAFGAVMGVFRRRMTRDLSELTPEQRSDVARAVRRGEAPRDASLAPATIKQAQRVQEENDHQWPYMVLGGFALLAVVIAVADALAGSLTTGDVLGVAFWFGCLPLLKRSASRASERARRAEAAARRM
jgi:hypothetical protein